MTEALVFSIEEFSVFDGPGIRTTVFLKGCPLRCEWCHNPEGQSFSNQILRSDNGCIGCGECFRRAERGEDGRPIFTEASILGCPQNLLRPCASSYTPQSLCERLSKNFAILTAAGGGITFSGGEPLAHPDFLLECLRLTRGQVHRAVQSCGFSSPDVFARVLDECDYMLFDLKLIDDALHLHYTGVSNRTILQNFATLASSKKEFVIRSPMIPNVTDTEDNIRRMASLLARNGVQRIELLPYNRLTGSKYHLIGREYRPSFDGERPVQIRTALFAEYGITAVQL